MMLHTWILCRAEMLQAVQDLSPAGKFKMDGPAKKKDLKELYLGVEQL